MSAIVSERTVIALIAAVNFVNILDFMMVMPLGPDFARALGLPTDRLGVVAGSYMLAGAVAGVAGMFVLDRFDRRPALAISMLGLSFGTLLGAFAVNGETLIAARCVAGFFGGPASSLALAIVADVVPAHRRGRAMGVVMGAFSLASILGVPAGLEIARIGGWRAPFVAVAVLGVSVTALMYLWMPALRSHLEGPQTPVGRLLAGLLARRPVQLMLLAIGLVMVGSFMLIPNLSAFIQFNAHYPRDNMGVLYLAGGLTSLVAMRIAGILTDRWGSTVITVAATTVLAAVLAVSFLPAVPLVPVTAIFMGFMGANSVRMVAMSTLASKVPAPHERAGYQSAQAAVMEATQAFGALFSAFFLVTRPDGSLGGMDRLASASIVLVFIVPFLVFMVERAVRRAAGAGPARDTLTDEMPADT